MRTIPSLSGILPLMASARSVCLVSWAFSSMFRAGSPAASLMSCRRPTSPPPDGALESSLMAASEAVSASESDMAVSKSSGDALRDDSTR